MSKKTVLFLTCALFLAFASLQGLAQSNPDQAASQAASTAAQTKDEASQAMADPDVKAKVEAKLQQLSTELNLTDDQKTQLQPVLQDEFKQLKAVHSDASLSPDQKKTKATEIHESAKSQMGSILTPEQKQKLATMKEKAKEDHDK